MTDTNQRPVEPDDIASATRGLDLPKRSLDSLRFLREAHLLTSETYFASRVIVQAVDAEIAKRSASREFLTPGFAVFNGHINRGDERARSLMRVYFPKYLDRLEEIEREGNGIMHVFNISPEPATTTYVALVFALVNEGREPPAPKVPE